MQSTSGCARASSSSIFLSVTDTSRRPIYLGGLSISTVSHAREMHGLHSSRPSQRTTFTAHDLHSARPSQRTTFHSSRPSAEVWRQKTRVQRQQCGGDISGLVREGWSHGPCTRSIFEQATYERVRRSAAKQR